MGVQWLSGRVLDLRPRGCGLEPHLRHCVVSLSKNINPSLVLVQPRKIHPYITERLFMGCNESNQTKYIYNNSCIEQMHLVYMIEFNFMTTEIQFNVRIFVDSHWKE